MEWEAIKKITAFGHSSRGGKIVSFLQPGDPGGCALDPWFCVTAFRRICPLKSVNLYKFTIVWLFCQ